MGFGSMDVCGPFVEGDNLYVVSHTEFTSPSSIRVYKATYVSGTFYSSFVEKDSGHRPIAIEAAGDSSILTIGAWHDAGSGKIFVTWLENNSSTGAETK